MTPYSTNKVLGTSKDSLVSDIKDLIKNECKFKNDYVLYGLLKTDKLINKYKSHYLAQLKIIEKIENE